MEQQYRMYEGSDYATDEPRAYPKRSPLWLRKIHARVWQPIIVLCIGSLVGLAVASLVVRL